MAAFEYKALDSAGKQKSGILEGDTAKQIRSRLRQQSLTPLTVVEIHKRKERGRVNAPGANLKISIADQALITRQLATLVKAGLPVEEAINTVAEQSEKPKLQRLLLSVRTRVLEGHPLASGLSDFPKAFSEIYRATVRAGESSGNLDTVLERLADYSETRQENRRELIGALIYPAIISLVAIGIVSGLLAFVVPDLVEVFVSTGQSLPALTQAIIALSDFIRAQGITVLIITVVIYLFYRELMKRSIGALRRRDRLILKVPLIGKLIKGSNTADFSRTMSILTSSGVPALEAMPVAAQVMTNLPMRESVMKATKRVSEGSNLHRALESDGYFPKMILKLVASGENSGQLDQMLERAATSQDREVKTLSNAVSTTLEPLMILLMGGMVLLIVIAILLPIFEMNNLVG